MHQLFLLKSLCDIVPHGRDVTAPRLLLLIGLERLLIQLLSEDLVLDLHFFASCPKFGLHFGILLHEFVFNLTLGDVEFFVTLKFIIPDFVFDVIANLLREKILLLTELGLQVSKQLIA